ncbi:Hypothetical predicted protein [Pelobates cultripes]|uniref:Uncharacterized protein n=1 Tax=Pelobates cultripes TaxID=61616 RepID=A0AAD1VRJ2_PELCU|nr:Hypothetical predicted protein [Pelobates cultripes]
MPFVQPQKQLKRRRKIEAFHPLRIPSLESFLCGDFEAGPRRTSYYSQPATQKMGRKSQRPATESDTRDIGAMLQKPRQTPSGDRREEASVPHSPRQHLPHQRTPQGTQPQLPGEIQRLSWPISISYWQRIRPYSKHNYKP